MNKTRLHWDAANYGSLPTHTMTFFTCQCAKIFVKSSLPGRAVFGMTKIEDNYRLMKAKRSSKYSEEAFKLTELCMVIACMGILAMLVLPALASGKIQSAATGCLYNLRNLQAGCAMYATENDDYLMPNPPLGLSASNTTWCLGAEALTTSQNANTNPAVYTSALLWPYLGNNLSVFRCPGDTVPSPNGFRLRSYSMNGQMGNEYIPGVTAGDNPGCLTYSKGSDIIRPTPANAFVFADESPDSIDDGYMQMASTQQAALTWGNFPNIPACYLEGGCGFSFADGHGEIHRWQTTSLFIPINREENELGAVGGTHNADWIWLSQHTTSPQ